MDYGSPALEVATLMLFPFLRFLVLAVLFRVIAYTVQDDHKAPLEENCLTLVLSAVSILHHGFFCVAMESTDSYLPVVFASVMNFGLILQRFLILIGYGENMVLKKKMVLSTAAFLLRDRATMYRVGKMQQTEESELFALYKKYLICQIAAWDIYKLVIPVMYIGCMWIITHGPNAEWLAGFGVSAYQYASRDKLTSRIFLDNVTVKFVVLILIDLLLLVVERLALYKAQHSGLITMEINIIQTMANCCKEYGQCIASLLSFILPNFICTIAIHCGMDFSMKFEWLGKANDYFTHFQKS